MHHVITTTTLNIETLNNTCIDVGDFNKGTKIYIKWQHTRCNINDKWALDMDKINTFQHIATTLLNNSFKNIGSWFGLKESTKSEKNQVYIQCTIMVSLWPSFMAHKRIIDELKVMTNENGKEALEQNIPLFLIRS